jgi:uncharacterized membrane protein
MIEFVLAIICFGIVGILMVDLLVWKSVLAIVLTTVGITLIRYSGVI